jgi:hypothetical protein
LSGKLGISDKLKEIAERGVALKQHNHPAAEDYDFLLNRVKRLEGVVAKVNHLLDNYNVEHHQDASDFCDLLNSTLEGQRVCTCGQWEAVKSLEDAISATI